MFDSCGHIGHSPRTFKGYVCEHELASNKCCDDYGVFICYSSQYLCTGGRRRPLFSTRLVICRRSTEPAVPARCRGVSGTLFRF